MTALVFPECARLPQALAESLPVMVWTSTSPRSRAYFNRAWLEYRGRTLEQETGSGWLQGVHRDDLGTFLEAHESGFEQQQPFQLQYRLTRHDGVNRWILEHAAPWISSTGDCLGFAGSSVDIHDRKLEETALRTANEALHGHNDELKQFAYGASHDLQEPLRTIASYTQLLASRHQGENDLSVQFVLGAVRRMQTLVSDLLNYSWVHNAELKTATLDANAVFRQALCSCQAAIQKTGAVVTSDPLPSVRADEKQFVQVLQNLFSNAVKYRRSDVCPRVHVTATPAESEWVFQVSDNGIGFEPQYAERIFGLFKRLHGHDKYEGAGLGLSICRRIVERHGGRMWAESEPGRGAQFFFTLPR